MPGRYFIVPSESSPNAMFPGSFSDDRIATVFASPRYNISPSQTAPILRHIEGELVASDMRWGFAPRWMKDPNKAQINARSETVFEKRMFQQAAKSQRCLVPASGWYEWQPAENGKQAWALHMEEYVPFAFAGLWTVGNDREGRPEENFLTLTTEPSTEVRPIHHRMPVILDADGCRTWLDPNTSEDELSSLFIPWSGPLAMHRISNYVSNPRHQGPECLEAAGK